MSQKHTVLKGAALLTAAGLAGRIIGFFYRIFLSRAIGDEGMLENCNFTFSKEYHAKCFRKMAPEAQPPM